MTPEQKLEAIREELVDIQPLYVESDVYLYSDTIEKIVEILDE